MTTRSQSIATLKAKLDARKAPDFGPVEGARAGIIEALSLCKDHLVMSNPALFLIDGGLTQQPLSRSQVVALMAADLIRLDAWRNQADAFRSLMELRLYSSLEVALYLEKAIYEAQQQHVAKIMSDKPGYAAKVKR